VAELYGPVAEAKGVELEVPSPESLAVQGDPDLLAQAIGNLVDNAVKFSPAGGKVTIAVARRAERQIAVSVSDRGPGIPDPEKSRVVERFYRGAAGRGVTGVGLGLSVVAAVARLHGGGLVLADGDPGLTASLIVPDPRHPAP